MKALANTWLRVRRKRRLLLPVPLPGRLGRAFRDGANLSPDQVSEGASWGGYLHQTCGTPRMD
jgi:hypothetical protein